MDLQSLFKQYFAPKQVFNMAPGESYGPAVSRYTRTPIKFVNNLEEGMSGQYLEYPSLIPGIPRTNTIEINPESSDIPNRDVKDIIRHEDIHALLDKTMRKVIGPKGDVWEALSILKDETPFYTNIEKTLSGKRGGYMPAEVPAYAGQRGYRQYGIDPLTRAAYIEGMVNTLKRLDPKAAKTYKYMSGAK